jgi:4-carboxymuconolactone decarboxylase
VSLMIGCNVLAEQFGPRECVEDATEKEEHMPNSNKESTIKKTFGDFAPKLVSLTNDVLFGDVWERKELAPRDRSLITVAALIAGGNSEQLPFHLNKAKENGLTETELKEVITHLAFYAGWPKAMSALTVAKQVFEG